MNFSISARSTIGILIGNALNLCTLLDSTDIVTILNLPFYEHGMSFHLFLFKFLSARFYSFQCANLSLPWLSLYLSILLLISLSSCSLLAYKNAADFLHADFISCYFAEIMYP